MPAPSLLLAALGVLATCAVSADTAIFVGPNAQDLDDQFWDSVSSSPNATGSAKFSGFDISKPFPGSAQDGWTLSVDLNTNLDDPDSDANLTATTMTLAAPANVTDVDPSWHFCVYVLNVKASSATNWGSGATPSCQGLVANECVDDLQKNGVANFKGDSCPTFETTASCLRDMNTQDGTALSVSSSDAATVFGKPASFFRRVDGSYTSAADADTVYAAAGAPLAVLTVWGPSGSSGDKPTASLACVMAGAEPVKSAAGVGPKSAFAGWTAVVAFAVGAVCWM